MVQKTVIKWVGGIVLSGIVLGGGYFAIQNFGTTARLERSYERIANLEREKVTCEIARKTLTDELDRLKGQVEELYVENIRISTMVDESRQRIREENEKLRNSLATLERIEIDNTCEASMDFLREHARGYRDEQ